MTTSLDPMQIALVVGAGAFTYSLLSNPPIAPPDADAIATSLTAPIVRGETKLAPLVRSCKLVDTWESQDGTLFGMTSEGVVVEWTSGWVSEYRTAFGESPFV